MPGMMTNNTASKLMKERVPAGGGPWKLLSFMVFVFVIFLFSYLGLTLGYRKFLEAQIDNKKQALTKLAEEIPKPQQDAYLQFEYQLLNVKKLLDKHVITANLLPLFEANTNQGVALANFDLSILDHRLNLQGTARTYQALAEQLEAYERMPQVVRYQISNTKLKEAGKVDFTAILTLDPLLFQLPRQTQ